MGITNLTIKVKKKGRQVQLRMRGNLSNFNSIQGRKLELLFAEPEDDSTSVLVDYKLYTTRRLCVGQTKTKPDTAESFRVARLAGTYLNETNHDCDVSWFTGITAINCYPYAGCIKRTKKFCWGFDGPEGLFYTNKTYKMATSNLTLVHTDDQPLPYPSVRILFRKPSPGQLRVQGSAFATTDPGVRNVAFWGSWYKIKKDYRPRRSLGRFRFTVEAVPFGARTCEN
jgi:hypothetical protein